MDPGGSWWIPGSWVEEHPQQHPVGPRYPVFHRSSKAALISLPSWCQFPRSWNLTAEVSEWMRMIKKTLKDSEKHISYGDLKGIECPTCARINKKNPGEQDQKKYEWMMLAIPFPTPKFLKRSFHATPKFQISKPPRVIMKVEHGSSSSGEICISTAGVVRVLGFCFFDHVGSNKINDTQNCFLILKIFIWNIYMATLRSPAKS